MTAPVYNSKYGGKSAAVIREEFAVRRDAVVSVTRCVRCPGWRFDGSAGDGRVAFLAHLTFAHPEVKPKRRRASMVVQARARALLRAEDLAKRDAA